MFYVTNYCRTGALGWWEINGFDRIPRFKLLSFGFIFYFSVVSVIKRRDRFASRTDKIWFRPKGIVEITFLYINCLSSVYNSAQNIFNKQIFDYVLFVFSNLINLLMNLLKSINVMNTRDYFIEWRYFSFMVKKKSHLSDSRNSWGGIDSTYPYIQEIFVNSEILFFRFPPRKDSMDRRIA